MPLGTIAAVLAEDPGRRADLLAGYWATVEATRLAQRHLAAYVMSQFIEGRRSRWM